MSNTEQVLDAGGLDTASLLESLSLDLMSDNIRRQINYETSSTTDFLDTVKEKFNAILQDEEIETEDKILIRQEIIDFCEQLIIDISEMNGIATNIVSVDYESIFDILDTLYNFFVLNRCENVEKFLIAYIEDNKSELISTLGIEERGKDVTSLSNKKKNVDKDNVCILSAVNEIIEFIRNGNFVEPEEFLTLLDDGEYYTSRLLMYYGDQTIVGNFTTQFLNCVLSEGYDSNEVTRIRNSIRTAFYIVEED